MSQPLLVKAYCNISPATPELCRELATILRGAMPEENAVLETDGSLCRFSFEGLWFPEDEAAECVKKHLRPDMRGKLDILDMETWRLKRHTFENGHDFVKTSPLNNVLDYSGF